MSQKTRPPQQFEDCHPSATADQVLAVWGQHVPMVLAVIGRRSPQQLRCLEALERQVRDLLASIEPGDKPRRCATKPSGAVVDQDSSGRECLFGAPTPAHWPST